MHVTTLALTPHAPLRQIEQAACLFSERLREQGVLLPPKQAQDALPRSWHVPGVPVDEVRLHDSLRGRAVAPWLSPLLTPRHLSRRPPTQVLADVGGEDIEDARSLLAVTERAVWDGKCTPECHRRLCWAAGDPSQLLRVRHELVSMMSDITNARPPEKLLHALGGT